MAETSTRWLRPMQPDKSVAPMCRVSAHHRGKPLRLGFGNWGFGVWGLGLRVEGGTGKPTCHLSGSCSLSLKPPGPGPQIHKMPHLRDVVILCFSPRPLWHEVTTLFRAKAHWSGCGQTTPTIIAHFSSGLAEQVHNFYVAI